MIKKIYSSVCYIASYVYPVQLKKYFLKINAKINYFSHIRYYSKKLKQCGSNLHLLTPCYIKGEAYMSFGDNTTISHDVIIEAYDLHNENKYNPSIILGNNVSIGAYSHIGCIDKVIIGNGVLIAGKVYISDHDHGRTDTISISFPPNKRNLSSKGPVIIEDNVWIGENVAILSGVTIGENSIIGANSVVTSSIPKNVVAVGAPAKVIKSII